MDVARFLNERRAIRLTVGQSGADVYEVDGSFILKHVVRGKLPAEQFDAYAREALFYQAQASRHPAYLPQALQAEVTDDDIVILMKKYALPDRQALDADLLRAIARSLAMVHADELPSFLQQSTAAEPLTDQQIAEALTGWHDVLAEHPGAFDERLPEDIAKRVNELILWHDGEARVLAHGDFHWDNLLTDERGHILLCDWQAVHAGSASGDLSFFLSRLGADGVSIDSAFFLEAYVEAVRALTGQRLKRQDILRHMGAANVITSFLFWHIYLHGSGEARVREIYGKMAKDWEAWLAR